MGLSAPALLLLLLLLLPPRAAAETCRGGPCPGAARSGSAHAPRPAPEAHASPQAHRGRRGDAEGGGARPRAHGVPPAARADAGCGAPPETGGDGRECRGVECRLPARARAKHRGRTCAGEGCGPPEPSVAPLHVSDRAAQSLGDVPDLGYPPPELGAAPLGVQLTCDITSGENEVPSEDALILHLQLARGQEALVEALRSQQVVVRELQQKLLEQQEALLQQQRAVLEQQSRMHAHMDAVKAQYGLLADALKQASLGGLQGELQGSFQAHLAGLQGPLQGPRAAGEAPPPGCPAPCGQEEYCDFQREPPRCQRCTVCPPGFFLVHPCSANADRMCQDRDECLELPRICGERVKCLNTPGGFRCLGVSEREAAAGSCGRDYFYNRELRECQACSDCEGEAASVPCGADSDAVCGAEARLSRAWAAQVAAPSPGSGRIFPGLQLDIKGSGGGELLSVEAGRLAFRQHGLVWMDHNFAVRHSCRNFLQVGMRLDGSQEEEGEEEGGRDLSGVRLEQPEGKSVQGVSVSAGVEAEPGQTLALTLRSPNQHCNQSRDLHVHDAAAAPGFSLLWLSHDTGAVAMAAQATPLMHHQASYRPAFRATSVSDPYMVALAHDGRGVRFTEGGVVKFALQHALFAMGHACVRDGFSVAAYISRNGTGLEAARGFRPGVDYRDTSVTLSGAVAVAAGDALSFEISAPPQCNVRYFADGTGVSALSLLWVPAGVSASLAAAVSRAGLPSGAVRNKALAFQQVGPDAAQVQLSRSGRRSFVFRQAGTASVALSLKLIHSCSVVKLTLQRAAARGGEGPAPLAQQVSGPGPEGARWAAVALRASFEVQNGTAVFVTLDCVRGRVNQVALEGGTNVSILWVAA